MSNFCRRLLLSAGTALALAVPVRAQDSVPTPAPPKPTKLFSSDSVFAITISSDMKKYAGTRDTTAPWLPARLVAGGDTLRIGIQPRGHFRRKSSSCSFPPMSVKFAQETKGTIFARQKKLKLVTACWPGRAEYEGYIPREYLLYRVYALLTPLSFRARLVRVTYVDTAHTGNDPYTTLAFFIEDQQDMAARNAGTPIAAQNAAREDFDPDALALLSLFEYMIGNTDLSFAAQHNIRFVRPGQFGNVFPVAYDFDWSGAVAARYATPDRSLPIRSVRDRIWMSYCLAPTDLASAIALFNTRRPEITALYTDNRYLDAESARWSLEYFDDFYTIVNDPAKLAKEIKHHCAG
jgi:hypothetical protein